VELRSDLFVETDCKSAVKVRKGVKMYRLSAKERRSKIIECLGEAESVMTLIGQCRANYATGGMVNHGIGLHHAEKRHDEEGRIVPGMVFTVESGIYLGEKGIGIRIEDDILITEDGYEVLSKSIPKELDDIEAMMK